MYKEVFLNVIKEDVTTASAGVGGTSSDLLHTTDTYATGDTRMPKVLGAKRIKGKKGGIKVKFPLQRRNLVRDL